MSRWHYTPSIEHDIDTEDINETFNHDAAEEQEGRQRNAAVFGWFTSIVVHCSVLALTLLIVVYGFRKEDRPPIQILQLPDNPPVERSLPEDFIQPDVQIEVAEELSSSAPLSDHLVFSDVQADNRNAPAVANVASQVVMAIGAGGGGGGAGGVGMVFQHGDNGDGGGGFFGIGDGGGGARRICLIIDQSRSLKDIQIAVIKDRLLNTLDGLKARQRFEVIFFSGPCWTLDQDPLAVRQDWSKGVNHHDYSPLRDLPDGKWRSYPPSIRKDVRSYVLDELQVTMGTDWRHPFKLAYAMDPQPDVIYFLTDGKVDNSALTLDFIKEQSAGSESESIPINTIAYGLNDQDGVASLKEMSDHTGGEHIALTMADIQEMYDRMVKEGRHLR